MYVKILIVSVVFKERVRSRKEIKGMWSGKRVGRGREWVREVVEGQSLKNWFCFLYVSDVLRLPAPFPAYRRGKEKVRVGLQLKQITIILRICLFRKHKKRQ